MTDQPTTALPGQTYILHEGYERSDGFAYFGPVPDDEDPFDYYQTDLWEQTGDLYLIDGADIDADMYINPYSVWLDPNSEEVTNNG